MTQTKKTRLPNKFEAILPILALLGLMISNYIWKWGIDPHVPVLILCDYSMCNWGNVRSDY